MKTVMNLKARKSIYSSYEGLIRLPIKGFFYYFNAYPLTLHSYYCLLSWYLDHLRKAQKQPRCVAIVKTLDGFLFAVRAWTSDLHIATSAERFELENWFKPLAKGVVVDVGAYIGTYTVRAMKKADLVVAIEPLPLNFKVLQVNVELNRWRRGDVILINKAVAKERKETQIYTCRELYWNSKSDLSYCSKREVPKLYGEC
jgi:hypothetical protein